MLLDHPSYQAREQAETEEQQGDLHMNCPYCNTTMLKGYLHAPRAIWRDNEYHTGLSPRKNEKYALFLRLPLVTPNRVESYCCPKCKKMIIDTAEYANNLE